MLKLAPLSRRKSMKNLKISQPIGVTDNSPPKHSSSQHVPPLPSLDKMAIPRSTPETTIILITKFDFKSENKHELSVGVGEALRLIERKGNGWILVKPIGRISKPGLIPASYVRIVKLDKKLGDLSNPYANDSKYDEKWLETKEENEVEQQIEEEETITSPKSNKDSISSNYSSCSSIPNRHSSNTSSNKYSSLQSSVMSGSDEQHFSFQSNTSTSTSTGNLSSPNGEFYAQSGLVRNASCHNGRYWYRVDITTNDGKKRYLCRYYQDFYKLHCAIIEQLRSLPNFKEEDITTKLPALPDPIPRPDLQTLSSILLQRVQSLNVYIFKIVQNKRKLDYAKILNDWSSPRLGDLEVAPYENISNEEIERKLEPLPTKLNKPNSPTLSSFSQSPSIGSSENDSSDYDHSHHHQKRPSLKISTSVTPPLPSFPAPVPPLNVFKKSHSNPNLLSSTSANTTEPIPSIPTFPSSSSPMVWESPTFQNSPSWNKSERSASNPIIHEGLEKKFDDWLQEPIQPLHPHSPKLKSRNFSSPSILQTKPEFLKVKVFANDDIFAIRIRNDISLNDLKQSILTRLELDVKTTIIKLYYKNQSKNSFLHLNDELDLASAFDQPKVSIKVHVLTKDLNDDVF